MKQKITPRLLLAVMMLVLVTTPSLAHDSQPSDYLATTNTAAYEAANASWFFDTVHTDNSYPFDDIGQHVSIALHPVNGRPYISYYNATQLNLRMAKYVVTGGNCGTNNDWECEIVDDAGNVGMYNSIAFNPIDNAPVIAYLDSGNGALKLADWMGNHWGFIEVHDPNFVSAGRYTSLKIDTSGNVHISFYVNNFLGYDSLWYAKFVGGSAGNCTNPNYECEQLAMPGDGIGKYTSLALDSIDNPRIAFWGEDQNRLGYVWYTGIWTFRWISDKTGDGAGKFASLAVDVNNFNKAHIAHYDSIHGTVEYATYVGTGGNCEVQGNTFEEWQCDVIDYNVGISTDPKGVSIALDGNGYPIIAYQSGGSGLKIARPTAALGLIYGNCGPLDPFNTWQCETLSLGIGFGQGDYMSLAVNSAGLSTIAYYGNVTGSGGDLKVAYQRLQVFVPVVLRNAN